MRYASVALGLAILASALPPPSQASAAPSGKAKFLSRAAIVGWIDNYRHKPEPSRVPEAIRALSEFGSLRDPETAGFFAGFVAGVLGANPKEAERLVARMLLLPPPDQWLVVRAIAYSGLPSWKSLLARVADKLPARRGMIDVYLTGALPTLDAIELDKSPTFLEQVGQHFGVKPKLPPLSYGRNPELLDNALGPVFRGRPVPAGLAHHRHAALVEGLRQRRAAFRRQLGEIHARQQRRALSRRAGADQGNGDVPEEGRAADSRRGDPCRRDDRDIGDPQGADGGGRAAEDRGPGLSARHKAVGLRRPGRDQHHLHRAGDDVADGGRPALHDRLRGDIGGAQLLGGAVMLLVSQTRCSALAAHR